MHWFNPSNLIPLIEIICNDKTEQKYVDEVYALAKAIDKKPVICRQDVPGFIANRVQLYGYCRKGNSDGGGCGCSDEIWSWFSICSLWAF